MFEKNLKLMKGFGSQLAHPRIFDRFIASLFQQPRKMCRFLQTYVPPISMENSKMRMEQQEGEVSNETKTWLYSVYRRLYYPVMWGL